MCGFPGASPNFPYNKTLHLQICWNLRRPFASYGTTKSETKMKVKTLGKISAALATALLAGSFYAGDVSANGDEKSERTTTQAARDVSGANNAFGFDLFKRLHKEGANTFISPTSISTALQMTSRGAKGDTLAEMNTTMHVEKLEVGQANRDLKDALSGRDDVKLAVANSIWADPSRITLNQEFCGKVKAEFDAEFESVSFADPKTRETINGWISDKTEKMIPELLKNDISGAVTVLVNAIYFKGNWTHKFDKAKTTDAEFKLADGTTAPIKLMSNKEEYNYAENDDLQLIGMPYGADKTIKMWVLLPKQGKSLDEMVKGLDAAKFAQLRERAWERDGTIKLPRFKMRFSDELAADLDALGMKKAFTSDADFSGFEEGEGGELFITKVIHEAVIDVNEEGTEAAAATAVIMERGMPPKPFTMVCDRPFLVVIADDVTGSILFMGTVYKPGE